LSPTKIVAPDTSPVEVVVMKDEARGEINISRIPVDGIGGLGLVVMAVVVSYNLPALRWVALIAMGRSGNRTCTADFTSSSRPAHGARAHGAAGHRARRRGHRSHFGMIQLRVVVLWLHGGCRFLASV
jgi:hypothetical protein